MTLTITNQSTSEIPFDAEAFFTALLSLKGNPKGTYEITFVDNEKIREINLAHLNRDYVTDIISFNLGDSSFIEGDIYIAPEKAQDNAKDYEVPYEEELKRLLVHGFLHLLDYRDYTDEEKDIMTREQERLLALTETQ